MTNIERFAEAILTPPQGAEHEARACISSTRSVPGMPERGPMIASRRQADGGAARLRGGER